MRVRWVLLFGLTAVLVAAGGVWWYHTSRPAYRLHQGQEALRRGDRAEALRQLDLLGSGDEACLLHGEICYRAGQFPEAVQAMGKMRAEGPLRVRAAALAGWCFLEMQDPWEAARHFHYALDQDPDNLTAHRGLARVYYHQGALAQAVAHLEEVTRLDPANGEAWQALGSIFKDLDTNRTRAIASYREALRRDLSAPDREAVRGDLAELLVKAGDYAEALDVLDGFDPQAAGRPAALALRGECLGALQRRDEARRLLDQALKDHPDSAELLRTRAKLHLEADEFEPAAALLARALERDRYDYPSRYLLAQTLEGLGRRAEAAEQRRVAEQTRRDLEELSRLNQEVSAKPWDAALRRRIADLCDQVGKPDLAVMWRRAAATCPPETR
jgi:tetratricopeptide (TPR) repeat protein